MTPPLPSLPSLPSPAPFSCPHVIQQELISPTLFTDSMRPIDHCSEGCCSDENWLCLSCGESRCGRYAQRHNLSHWKETGHRIALSLRDLSVWCYECDKYLKSVLLEDILNFAQHYKSLLDTDPRSEEALSPRDPPTVEAVAVTCCICYDPLTERHRPLTNLPPICQLENPERTKALVQHLTDLNLLYRSPHRLHQTPNFLLLFP